jgi:hypothetical protein
MKPPRSVRLFLFLTLAGLAAGAVQVGARPTPAPALAPPPPMPDVGLAEPFVHDAAAYQRYMRESGAIAPNFTDGMSVAQSLRVGAAYQPAQFLRGELAYAAIAALQDRTFVDAVRAEGQTPEQRYAIVARIYADPANALRFTDGRGAAGLAKAALTGDGLRLLSAGKAVRKSAYDIQRQPWSHDDVADRDGRLMAVKMLATTGRLVTTNDESALQSRVGGVVDLGSADAPAPPPFSPLVVRAVALAALAAIGQADEEAAQRLSWLSQDYFTEHCLTHAKNELNECLAVAKPHYEDIFCLGQQAMMYTAECVVKGAGGVVPLEIHTTPLSVPPVHGGAAPTHRRRS